VSAFGVGLVVRAQVVFARAQPAFHAITLRNRVLQFAVQRRSLAIELLRLRGERINLFRQAIDRFSGLFVLFQESRALGHASRFVDAGGVQSDQLARVFLGLIVVYLRSRRVGLFKAIGCDGVVVPQFIVHGRRSKPGCTRSGIHA